MPVIGWVKCCYCQDMTYFKAKSRSGRKPDFPCVKCGKLLSYDYLKKSYYTSLSCSYQIVTNSKGQPAQVRVRCWRCKQVTYLHWYRTTCQCGVWPLAAQDLEIIFQELTPPEPPGIKVCVECRSDIMPAGLTETYCALCEGGTFRSLAEGDDAVLFLEIVRRRWRLFTYQPGMPVLPRVFVCKGCGYLNEFVQKCVNCQQVNPAWVAGAPQPQERKQSRQEGGSITPPRRVIKSRTRRTEKIVCSACGNKEKAPAQYCRMCESALGVTEEREEAVAEALASSLVVPGGDLWEREERAELDRDLLG